MCPLLWDAPPVSPQLGLGRRNDVPCGASQWTEYEGCPRAEPCAGTMCHTHAHIHTFVSDLGKSCSPLPRLPMISFSMTTVLSPLVMMPWPLLS